MKFLVLLVPAKKKACGIFLILMNKKTIIPISFESWNRYDKIYENTSFVIPLDKKLDNLFHNKLVSCLSFANGAIFGDPSSFLTPSKKAKLSWAYFPKIHEVLFARYLFLVDVYIDDQRDTTFFMSR